MSRAKTQLVTSAHAKTNALVTQVERLAACGLDESEIAYCLGTDVVTLKQFYQNELDMGLAVTIGKLGVAQIKAGLRGDSAAAQFMLRSRGRWVTPTKIEQDVTLTVQDKRGLMDQIIDMYAKARVPITIEATPQQQKKLERAIAPEGSKPS